MRQIPITKLTEGGKEIPARSPVKRRVNTTVAEIYKFVAINFLMGHVRKGSPHSSNVWKSNAAV